VASLPRRPAATALHVASVGRVELGGLKMAPRRVEPFRALDFSSPRPSAGQRAPRADI